ncbi:hypothetical protein AN958_00796 [Leucoagaricus sp. SymC.cos]|nr:hypothetical protein AN958_00796 [Leucoagaricus sp. SymC.cos]
MARGLSNLVALAVFAVAVADAQVTGTYPATPLASKTGYTYPSGPYQVDTDTGLIRGVQAGYNICNSTTENQDSLCQTSFINGVDDFCLWAAIKPNSTVGDVEGEMVAWCTKPGRGTRLIPESALKGVQFMKTPDYVQVVGFIDQTLINLNGEDYGGEMDPHGADLRGNPMGGIIFSQSFNGQWVQVREWHNFMGSNAFCLKACDPSKPNDARYCEHRLDRIGCAYNAPNNAQNGTFESCEGDNQDFPGVYTLNGQALTYAQPPEALGPITTMPYTARVPASSNCVQYTSSAIYTGLPRVVGAESTGSGATTTRPTGSTSRSAAGATNTSGGERAVTVGAMILFGVMGSVISFLLA